MRKILISQPIPAGCLEPYDGLFEFTVPQKPLTYEEVLAKIEDYHGYMIINNKGDQNILDQGKSLQAVGNLGVGYDNIDWRYATQKGVAVINTPSTVTDATAELTIALIISSMRGIARCDRELRQNIWNSPVFSDQDTELVGRTLGIWGFGRIGKRVCAKARGLGMKVIYYDQYRAAEEVEKEYGVTYKELDELLAESDCITLHMPYTPENYHLVTADTFKKMKTRAYLVNAARGPIVDEEALADALIHGEIKGAGLDVYEHEPTVNPRILVLDNVTLTPHVASCTLQTRIDMCNEALRGITDILSGKVPYNLVNPEVIKK